MVEFKSARARKAGNRRAVAAIGLAVCCAIVAAIIYFDPQNPLAESARPAPRRLSSPAVSRAVSDGQTPAAERELDRQPASCRREEFVGRVRVVDGHTVAMRGKDLRIEGVDAPEGRQPCFLDGKPWMCGRASADALAHFIAGAELRFEHLSTDRYGRPVVRCRKGEEDIGRFLVREG